MIWHITFKDSPTKIKDTQTPCHSELHPKPDSKKLQKLLEQKYYEKAQQMNDSDILRHLHHNSRCVQLFIKLNGRKALFLLGEHDLKAVGHVEAELEHVHWSHNKSCSFQFLGHVLVHTNQSTQSKKQHRLVQHERNQLVVHANVPQLLDCLLVFLEVELHCKLIPYLHFNKQTSIFYKQFNEKSKSHCEPPQRRHEATRLQGVDNW